MLLGTRAAAADQAASLQLCYEASDWAHKPGPASATVPDPVTKPLHNAPQGLVRHAQVIERAAPLGADGDAAGAGPLGSHSPSHSHSGASSDFSTLLASRGCWGEAVAQQVGHAVAVPFFL
jgi:hypothetical protein